MMWFRERWIFLIPVEMNSNADWAKCLTTLRGNHCVNLAAKIIK